MKSMGENKVITPVTEKVSYIDDNGNVAYRQGPSKYCLSVEQNTRESVRLKKVTKDYYFMDEISNDCFVVCDINEDRSFECQEEYDDSKLAFKFGIITLQRDSQGNIIPMGEKVLVPIVYHDISEGNLKTIIAVVNDHFTYIDMNSSSENFGKQLVPAVLEYAVPFSEKYEGFAECSVDGVVGYLPRNCQPRTSLNSSELLTEEQVMGIFPVIEQQNNSLQGSLFDTHSELPGKVKSYGAKPVAKTQYFM